MCQVPFISEKLFEPCMFTTLAYAALEARVKEKQGDADIVEYPLVDCADLKENGVCRTFPQKYQGILGRQATLPAALIEHNERERGKCLNENKLLLLNSQVRRRDESRQYKTAAVYVLPPLPPNGSCVFSEDTRFILKETLYELTLHGKSKLTVSLTPEGESADTGSCVRNVGGLSHSVRVPHRAVYYNEKKLANAVVLHNSWDKDEEGNQSPDTYIVVICTPNIDDFKFEKKPSPVPITSLFEKRSVYFLQLKEQEFYDNFFPVS